MTNRLTPKQWLSNSLNALLLVGIMILPANQAMAAPPNPTQWVQSFGDEFNGTTVDKTKWLTTLRWDMRNNAGNAEAQYYMDNAFTFQNGKIHLIARKKPAGGFPYQSGVLCTYGKFSQQYGYYEIRARMPKGKGMWPAFWLLPVRETWPPEIDILEFLGHDLTTMYMTNHYFGPDGSYRHDTESYTGPDFSAGFHTFGALWEKGKITYYVDGVQRYVVTTNVPDEPMYVIANLAVGGHWPGYPDATTKFPQRYSIEWIRVWKKK